MLSFALPDYKNAPTLLSEFDLILLISKLISFELWQPVFKACFWRAIQPTSNMSVPDAAMYKYDFLPAAKYQIGYARQFSYMKPVAIAHSMNKPPNQ